MIVTRKRTNYIQSVQFYLNEFILEQVKSFKYLGVLISSDMSWSPHIDSICSKGRKLVGLLYRKFSTNTDSKSLLELYTMLVHPHLEYAAQVWSPVTNNDIKKIENVQKFALKMCVKNWLSKSFRFS